MENQSPFYLVDYVTLINTTTIFAVMTTVVICIIVLINMLRLVLFFFTPYLICEMYSNIVRLSVKSSISRLFICNTCGLMHPPNK